MPLESIVIVRILMTRYRELKLENDMAVVNQDGVRILMTRYRELKR